MRAHVPSVIQHRELVKIILEYGLILFCGDRALTDGVTLEKSRVGVGLLGQVTDVEKKQHRVRNRSFLHT